MFETEKIQASVHKISYDGKQDIAEDISEKPSEGMVKSAIILVTFRVPLQGDIADEVEKKYYPGLEERIEMTLDNKRHFKDSLRFKEEEMSMIVELEGDDKMIKVNGVELYPPVVCIVKKGSADLFVRVRMHWGSSLDILKSLDNSDVLLTLVCAQPEFREVMAAAELNQKQKLSEAETETDEDVFGSSDELGAFDLDPEASRKPMNEKQVNYHLCTKTTPKIQDLLNEYPEHSREGIAQASAIIAFRRQAKPGAVVVISLDDFDNAVTEMGA